jgi:Tol biopolymer transport system component
MAFGSDRSGAQEIWLSDPNGNDPQQLTALGGTSHSVRWSPDGSLLVFSCLKNGNRDIYTIPPDGGAPRRLTTDAAEDGRPAFSRDGNWIYFYSFRSGTIQVWRISLSGGSPIQITRNGGHESQESWDGQTLYFTDAGTGLSRLMSVPVSGGEEKLENEAIGNGLWSVTQKGIAYADRRAVGNVFPILLWNPITRKTSRLGVINGRVNAQGSGSFSTSSDARRFAWAQIDREESDLMLVENFR